MEHTNKDTQRAYAERPDIMQAMIEGNRFAIKVDRGQITGI